METNFTYVVLTIKKFDHKSNTKITVIVIQINSFRRIEIKNSHNTKEFKYNHVLRN